MTVKRPCWMLTLAFLWGVAHAHHGPGTSAGGAQTQSALTLKEGKSSLSLSWDYTQFKAISETNIESETRKIGGKDRHFDALRWSLVQTLDLAYGVTDALQLGFSTGWYRANDLEEGHIHANGSYGFHRFGDVSGATDPWLKVKYRCVEADHSQIALYGGIKFPTGTDDAISREDKSSNTKNTPLEASLQPGSGAFDFKLGAAYSRVLRGANRLDVSLDYTLRTENDEFKIGDRIDTGVALTHGVSDRLFVIGEVDLQYLFRNEEDGESIRNTGGTTVFLSPGVRFQFSERVSGALSPQIPVFQDLYDRQQGTAFRILIGLSASF